MIQTSLAHAQYDSVDYDELNFHRVQTIARLVFLFQFRLRLIQSFKLFNFHVCSSCICWRFGAHLPGVIVKVNNQTESTSNEWNIQRRNENSTAPMKKKKRKKKKEEEREGDEEGREGGGGKNAQKLLVSCR